MVYLFVIFSGFFFSLFLPDFPNEGTLGPGCYWGFTLIIPEVDCRGFSLAKTLEIYLGAWLVMLYSLLFFLKIKTISGVIILIGIWLPIVYLIWYRFIGRHLTSSLKMDGLQPPFN